MGHAWGRPQADRWAAAESLGQGTFLDIGCSTGAYVRLLRDLGRRAFGADLNADPAWQGGWFCRADAVALPWPDESVDFVLAFEVLEHVPRPAEAVAELVRVARRGLVVSVPDCEDPPGLRSSGLAYHHWTDRSHMSFFTATSLAALLTEAGAEVERIEPINPVYPERLLLRLWRVPDRVAGPMSRLLARSPLRRPLHMTLLATARVARTGDIDTGPHGPGAEPDSR